jgi:hypothetical protein
MSQSSVAANADTLRGSEPLIEAICGFARARAPVLRPGSRGHTGDDLAIGFGGLPWRRAAGGKLCGAFPADAAIATQIPQQWSFIRKIRIKKNRGDISLALE